MALNDSDLELLTCYLDGQLPTSECEGLWRRMAVESELAQELELLRDDLQARELVWQSMEPSDRALATTEAIIFRGAKRLDLRYMFSNVVRISGAAAAFLLIGFSVGSYRHQGIVPSASPSSPMANVAPASIINPPVSTAPHKYIVRVKDDAGHVVATQEFDSLEEAQHFADDLARSQTASPESGTGTATTTSENQF
jgi:hypothetical protein